MYTLMYYFYMYIFTCILDISMCLSIYLSHLIHVKFNPTLQLQFEVDVIFGFALIVAFATLQLGGSRTVKEQAGMRKLWLSPKLF